MRRRITGVETKVTRADLADIGWKLLGAALGLGLLAVALDGVLARLMAYSAGITALCGLVALGVSRVGRKCGISSFY